MGKNYSEIEDYLRNKNFQKRIDKLVQKYKDKKIMIYGASMAFNIIKQNYGLSGLNIIGIADIRFNDGEEQEGYEGWKTYNSYTFLNEKPDVVLIGMLESEVAEYFFEDVLIPKFGDFEYEPLIKKSFFESLKELFSFGD